MGMGWTGGMAMGSMSLPVLLAVTAHRGWQHVGDASGIA